MAWLGWLMASVAISLAGAYLFRTGRTGVVRVYAWISVTLFAIYFMNGALVFGAQYLFLPKYLLLAFLPGTLLLIVWAIKRDRDEVMGLAGKREAGTAAAIVYGAGSYAEMGDVGGGMDSQ